jgi:hypothetical protein
MCARPDQHDPRDQAIARLLAEALKPGSSSSQGCPDAELVAAYADQGLAAGPGKGPLGNDGRLQLEVHFAGCERCQKILAVLGGSLEAAASQPVVAMPAPVARPAPARPSPQRWLWWLSPAFGAAAAALLWMVLRPARPEPVQTAADYSRAAQQETRALNAPASPQAAAEAPPIAAERRDAQVLDRLSKVESAAKETKAETRGPTVALFAAPTADSAPPAAPPAPAAAPLAAGQSSVPPVPPARNQIAAANEQAPLQARTTVVGALGGTLSAQSAADLQVGGGVVAPGGRYTFASPTGGALWRVGAAGLIERSTDNSQTWQQQASGVTVDLLAGSASSNEVAWVVGRATVILRTINGQQWQRIAPPAGVTGDWVTVVVRSATSATVVGPIRRFSTEDGGMTWTEQP